MTTDLSYLFLRDLERLNREIAAFPSTESLWVRRDGISNSAGNLCLHLCGNLRHFIGAVLGDSGYVRNREAEFNDTGYSIDELTALIETTKNEVQAAFSTIDASDWEEPFPIQVFDQPMSKARMTMHLLGHLNYHLGQINYFRRIS